MTIKHYQRLEPKERFTILIERLKNDSYINDNGIVINVFSDHFEIKKELQLFGIATIDKTIEEILDEIIKEKNIRFSSWGKNNDIKKLTILTYYMQHLGFYIYDYNINEMPNYLKEEYKVYEEYSVFFKSKSLFKI